MFELWPVSLFANYDPVGLVVSGRQVAHLVFFYPCSGLLAWPKLSSSRSLGLSMQFEVKAHRMVLEMTAPSYSYQNIGDI